jgi:hypothetical protein
LGLNPLIVALALAVTIAAAVGLGVMLGYGAIAVVLQAMRHGPQHEVERAFTPTEVSSSS